MKIHIAIFATLLSLTFSASLPGEPALQAGEKDCPEVCIDGCNVEERRIKLIDYEESQEEECTYRYEDECTNTLANICTPKEETITKCKSKEVCLPQKRDVCVDSERLEERIAVNYECRPITKTECVNKWVIEQCGEETCKVWACSGEYITVETQKCENVQSLYNVTVGYNRCEREAFTECHWEEEPEEVQVTTWECERKSISDCKKIVKPDCKINHIQTAVNVVKRVPIAVCINTGYAASPRQEFIGDMEVAMGENVVEDAPTA